MKISWKHKILFLLLPCILGGLIRLDAQQANSMYLMHGIPQTSFLNPAVQIQCRWFLGIPGLSSTHLAYGNTAFTYRDLTGGNSWNLEQVERQMHRRDLYGSEFSLQLFAIGHRRKSSYFTFSVDDRIHMYQTIPGNLIATAVYGNYPTAGSSRTFNGLRTYGIYARQYALGVSRVISRSLTAGIRMKMLFGKAVIGTGPADIGLYTDENNFALLAEGNYILNASLPLSVDQDANGSISGITWNEADYADLLLNRGNPGIALDLGIIYRYDPKLTLSASLLDVGGLLWRTELNNVSSQGTFVYEAIESNGDVISRAFLEQLIDSLQNAFNLTVGQEGFSTPLPAQLFFGASYRLNDKLSLGLVNRNLLLRSKLHSSLTLLATTSLTARIRTTLSWSYLNNSARNLGAVIALQGQGFQFYLSSDNLVGFLQPFDTRTLNLRMGFNVLFGCPRNKKEALEAAYDSNPLGVNCDPPERERRGGLKYRRLRNR